MYHPRDRPDRGERVVDREKHAEAFVDRLRDVVQRDGLADLACYLTSSHYHLPVLTGVISLYCPLCSLQLRITCGVNLRRRVYGPLWQGRHRATLVENQRYLEQLLISIHVNPVTAGLVDDAAACRWSGHHKLLGATVGTLRSRQRDQEPARARELLVILWGECYGSNLKAVARTLGESPDGMTEAVARAARHRTEDDRSRS